jgi:membrane-associated phospholipid phosphatase
LYLPCSYGANEIDQTIAPPQAGENYMTTFAHYLNIQNGKNSLETVTPFGPRRYISNGRDLAAWVHVDVLWQAYFMATLQLMGVLNVPVNPTNPYLAVTNQRGFGTFGAPHFATLVVEVATRALHAIWYQKWFVHRRLRPEAFGARIHMTKAGIKVYDIHNNVLTANATQLINQTYGTWFLPQAFPEGSPLHPSYGAGHATVAGACTTIVKALFDGSATIPNPMIPDPLTSYTTLIPYNGTLTVEGELNKLAANVAYGRNFAGVHYNSDATSSLALGEQIAIETLRDIKSTFHEPFSGWSFTKFDGTMQFI